MFRAMKTKKSRAITGHVFYRGASMLDGAPIVGIAITGGSTNRKTGNLIQTYILRSDIAPIDAIRSGADYSICGNCPHRGTTGNGKGRTCYVNIGQGPRAVYDGFTRGIYPDASQDDMARICAGRTVRIGTYGDPAAIPFEYWRTMLRNSTGNTGYSHQWRDFPEFAAICMASADSVADMREANAAGWRTFRVIQSGTDLVQGAREIYCPASEIAGKKLTCAECLACGGNNGRRANIAIPAHGNNAVMKAFRDIAIVAGGAP